MYSVHFTFRQYKKAGVYFTYPDTSGAAQRPLKYTSHIQISCCRTAYKENSSSLYALHEPITVFPLANVGVWPHWDAVMGSSAYHESCLRGIDEPHLKLNARLTVQQGRVAQSYSEKRATGKRAFAQDGGSHNRRH